MSLEIDDNLTEAADLLGVEKPDEEDPKARSILFSRVCLAIAKQGKPKRSGKFVPPTVEQVAEYCKERGNSVDPEAFVSHYEANGWYRGKTKIKSWQAAVRTWEKNGKTPQKESLPHWSDDRAWEKFGAERGISPRPRESWTEFKSRVKEAVTGE